MVLSCFLTDQKQENRFRLFAYSEKGFRHLPLGGSLGLASLLPQAIKRNESLLLFLTFEVFKTSKVLFLKVPEILISFNYFFGVGYSAALPFS
ncbi:hypothetical protein SAMN06265367_104350 [Algoriphagus winogradskyi]|uniref:Uncharacterized protein n=1 Tax=Algoriphagus winogradskyi TaxID=237017 RepID=A0ABY1P4I9_9BACT|nr:hypothetical protein SAMN06265367_104350 [Algoriphagus winogradskyi]